MSIGIPFGKYRLMRRLARGGMAEVFLASQQGPGGFERTVAVKRILPHLADIPQFLDMFMDEAQLAAQLSHPNIAHIYEFGQVEDSYFIAMEYIDGIDLSVVVLEGRQRPMPLQHAARIIADVCAALHHAHQLKGKDGRSYGIVHRDISPQNILVSFDGAVKMVDFGIAKAAYHIERTRPGVVRGKFTYMSPEQVMGKQLDGRSDLFSAGIVLYELCTCQALFPRTDAVQAMQLIRKAEIPPPARDGEPLPPPLTKIIQRALAQNRDERYQTAVQMQMDLEEYLRSAEQPSNSILLAEYFSQHYRRMRPEPGASESKGTAHVERTARVERRSGGRPMAGGTMPVYGATDTEADRPLFSDGTVAEIDGPTRLQSRQLQSGGAGGRSGQIVKSQVSGIIHSQPTEQKAVADTRYSLHSTLLDPDLPRTQSDISDTGELDHPTIEIATGPSRTISTVDEGATTLNRAGEPLPAAALASTTLAVRSFRRRLIVTSLIVVVAMVGVLVGYVISTPPAPLVMTTDATGPLPSDVDSSAAANAAFEAGMSEGTLVVSSDPPGASLEVDDLTVAGVTPLERRFPPGGHILIVSLAEHAPQQQVVQLEAGQILKVSFILRKLAPEKVVQLRASPGHPPRTAVRRGGRAEQTSAVRRGGRAEQTRRKHRRKPRRTIKGRPPLVQSKGLPHGYLNITSIPWSWVYLGRKKLGQTPLANVKVPAGTHRLFFSNPEGGETFRTVKVQPGQVTKLRVKLR